MRFIVRTLSDRDADGKSLTSPIASCHPLHHFLRLPVSVYTGMDVCYLTCEDVSSTKPPVKIGTSRPDSALSTNGLYCSFHLAAVYEPIIIL